MIWFSLLKVFFQSYWKVLLPTIIIGAVFLRVETLTKERDSARSDLRVMTEATELRIQKNTEAKAIADQTQAASEASYNQQVKDLHIDKTTLTNAIKGYYDAPANIKHTMVPDTGIVLPQPSSGSSTTSSGNSEGLTEGEGECRATIAGLQTQIKTLEDGLVEETLEFIRARSRIDQDCAQIGCASQ